MRAGSDAGEGRSPYRHAQTSGRDASTSIRRGVALFDEKIHRVPSPFSHPRLGFELAREAADDLAIERANGACGWQIRHECRWMLDEDETMRTERLGEWNPFVACRNPLW